MDILGLSTSPSSGGAYALILNENEGNRRLPIIIGTFEAQAVAMELERIKPPRPMTHDLLRNIMQSFDTFVKYILINDLKEGTFYAQIVYEYNGADKEIDARPSDAIALAIRFNAPIYVSNEVLSEVGIYSDEQGKTDSDQTKTKIEVKSDSKPQSPGDKVKDLEKKLQAAIKDENYEKAARLRDELNKMKG